MHSCVFHKSVWIFRATLRIVPSSCVGSHVVCSTRCSYKKNRKWNDVSMLFLFSAVSAFCSFPLISYHDIFSLSVQNVLYLLILGVCSQLMQYFLFISFREACLTSLASVRYLEFVIQSLCGFVFFSEIPSVSSIGCAMIILFTVFFLNRVRSTKNVDRKI